VKSKLPYPDMAEFVQGWFPESAVGIEDTFCFVSLDADFYDPMLAGLRWFGSRLSPNGVIALHDYYNQVYGQSVREAVRNFLAEEQKQNRMWRLIPVGDAFSVGIIRCG
jgi:hypothetical protein